jgi:hypothetical protein
MPSDFRDQFAAAVGVPASPLSEVQRLYNEHKKFLSGKIIKTPLPEDVHLLDENFPYWIHLQVPDLTRPGEWVSAKPCVVLPLLEKGIFDDTGYRYDERRARSLSYIPTFLRNPHCVHVNMSHIDRRGDGGIRGDHMYVENLKKKNVRKVAFTLFDERLQKIVLVSSFLTYKRWVDERAQIPATYVRQHWDCTCGK